GLPNEAVDDAVELDVVVETLLRQQLDTLHVRGRQMGPQLDQHAPRFQLDDEGVLRVGRLGAARRREGEEGKREAHEEADHETLQSLLGWCRRMWARANDARLVAFLRQ